MAGPLKNARQLLRRLGKQMEQIERALMRATRGKRKKATRKRTAKRRKAKRRG